jgi:hypothetical protein
MGALTTTSINVTTGPNTITGFTTFNGVGPVDFSTTGPVNFNTAVNVTGINTFTMGTGLATFGGDVNIVGDLDVNDIDASGYITAVGNITGNEFLLTSTNYRVAEDGAGLPWVNIKEPVGGNKVLEMGLGTGPAPGFTPDEYGLQVNEKTGGAMRAGIGYSAGLWSAGVTDGTNAAGAAYNPVSGNTGLTVLAAGVPVFYVDQNGDIVALSMNNTIIGNTTAAAGTFTTLTGANVVATTDFTLTGTTVTGITTAAWVDPGSASNLVTEAAVTLHGDANYVRRDGTLPLTGDWAAGAFEISADGGVFLSLEAVNSFKTSGSVYSHLTTTTAAPYVVTATDHVIVANAGASIDLPAMTATTSGRILIIKNNTGAVMPVTPSAGQFVNVNGAVSNPYIMPVNGAITLISDFGSLQWYAVSF